MLIIFLVFAVTLSYGKRVSNLQNIEESELHDVAYEYGSKDIYYLTDTKFGIISVTNKENLQFTKLIYSITTTKSEKNYTLTLNEIDKVMSIFYFTAGQIEEINKIEGCSVEQKEYKYEYNNHYYI